MHLIIRLWALHLLYLLTNTCDYYSFLFQQFLLVCSSFSFWGGRCLFVFIIFMYLFLTCGNLSSLTRDWIWATAVKSGLYPINLQGIPSHFGFICIFLITKVIEHFSSLLTTLDFPFFEEPIQIPCLFLCWDVLFLLICWCLRIDFVLSPLSCACVAYTISQCVAHLFALLIVILDKEKFWVLI